MAGLLRRLKTIYAITGGEIPNEKGGKKDDFNAKKSMLIAQIHNFDEVRTPMLLECGMEADIVG